MNTLEPNDRISIVQKKDREEIYDFILSMNSSTIENAEKKRVIIEKIDSRIDLFDAIFESLKKRDYDLFLERKKTVCSFVLYENELNEIRRFIVKMKSGEKKDLLWVVLTKIVEIEKTLYDFSFNSGNILSVIFFYNILIDSDNLRYIPKVELSKYELFSQ